MGDFDRDAARDKPVEQCRGILDRRYRGCGRARWRRRLVPPPGCRLRRRHANRGADRGSRRARQTIRRSNRRNRAMPASASSASAARNSAIQTSVGRGARAKRAWAPVSSGTATGNSPQCCQCCGERGAQRPDGRRHRRARRAPPSAAPSNGEACPLADSAAAARSIACVWAASGWANQRHSPNAWRAASKIAPRSMIAAARSIRKRTPSIIAARCQGSIARPSHAA